MSDSPRLGVTRLIQEIRRLVEPPFNQVVVHGEVANFSQHRSGHLYFVLKDGRSRIQCMMQASAARRLNFPLSDGLQIVVRASVRIYPERGSLQLQVAQVRPDGLGQLYAALEKLKAKLSEEGLFDSQRKRSLPFLPRRVALITSPQGAVVHDIWTTLRRRNSAVELWLVPAAVQGPQAARELVMALRLVAEYRSQVDCLIIARGGGSLEDLMPFNHEAVVRHLGRFPIPVVSAVGHETDVTLCDLVADVRAATPTAAAELVAPPRQQLLDQLCSLGERMVRALNGRAQQHQNELLRMQTVLQGYPERRLERERERMAVARLRLDSQLPRRLEKERHDLRNLRVRLDCFQPERQLQSNKNEIASLKSAVERSLRHRLERRRSELSGLKSFLEALSPLRVLDRGYTLCLDEEGRPVTRAAGRKAQDLLEVRFLDGSLSCRVEAPPLRGPADSIQSGNGPRHGLEPNQL